MDRDAIHFAVAGGNLELVKILCDDYEQLMNDDKNNRTPLHYAVDYQKEEIVSYLINQGASINAQDHDVLSLNLIIHLFI